jgi:hypothetical protein
VAFLAMRAWQVATRPEVAPEDEDDPDAAEAGGPTHDPAGDLGRMPSRR